MVGKGQRVAEAQSAARSGVHTPAEAETQTLGVTHWGMDSPMAVAVQLSAPALNLSKSSLHSEIWQNFPILKLGFVVQVFYRHQSQWMQRRVSWGWGMIRERLG